MISNWQCARDDIQTQDGNWIDHKLSALYFYVYSCVQSFNDLFSRHRIQKGAGTFTEKLFIVRLSHTAHLHDSSNLLYRI